MKIAVIDRGVDPAHRRMNGARIEQHTIHNNGSTQVSGHGTAIAAIIHKHVRDARIISVAIGTDTLNEQHLCDGIRFCLKDDDIRIVNISLGITAQPSEELIALCKTAYEKDVFIVAASYYVSNVKCYPAYLPYVIGVGNGLVKKSDHFKLIALGAGTNILAKGTIQRVSWSDDSFKIRSGTSFATAHFTGILGSLVTNQTTTFDSLSEVLANYEYPEVENINSLRTQNQYSEVLSQKNKQAENRELFLASEKLSFANSLAIFPASDKEVNTLVEYQDLSIKPIEEIIDVPKIWTGQERRGYKWNIATIDFECFDTIVLGYFLDNPLTANLIFASKLIRELITREKHFVTWDRDVYYYVKERLPENYPGKLIYICVREDIYQELAKYRYLPGFKKPVISVIGTSSKQGKVTTQFQIKKILMEEGYKVAHMSTEPQGVLLGAEFAFPYAAAKNSDVYLPQQLWYNSIGVIMRGIQHFVDPDILLTGTQGYTIPPAIIPSQEIEGITSSLDYLTSVRSDALIIVINVDDEIEFIKRTIHVAQSYSNSAKILFGVIYPFRQKGNEHVPTKKERVSPEYLAEQVETFEKELQIRILDIKDSTNNEIMLSLIQDFFS